MVNYWLLPVEVSNLLEEEIEKFAVLQRNPSEFSTTIDELTNKINPKISAVYLDVCFLFSQSSDVKKCEFIKEAHKWINHISTDADSEYMEHIFAYNRKKELNEIDQLINSMASFLLIFERYNPIFQYLYTAPLHMCSEDSCCSKKRSPSFFSAIRDNTSYESQINELIKQFIIIRNTVAHGLGELTSDGLLIKDPRHIKKLGRNTITSTELNSTMREVIFLVIALITSIQIYGLLVINTANRG